MRIVVTISSSDPPEGHLTSNEVDAPFVGWLGLIRLLADAVAADPQDEQGFVAGHLEATADSVSHRLIPAS